MAAGSGSNCSKARRGTNATPPPLQPRIVIRQADAGFVADVFNGDQGERVTRLAFSDAESTARSIRLRLLQMERHADAARAAALNSKGRV